MFTATKPLPLTVPTIVGESATSFASRLARRNGVPRMITFCSDVGVDYFALVNGDPIEITRLAVLGGIDPVPLQAATPSLIEPGWFRLGKERIKFTAFSRTTVRICPKCVMGASGDMAVIHRGLWQLSSHRICAEHGTFLVTLPNSKKVHDSFDHIALLREYRPTEANSVNKADLALEHYLIDRVENGPGAAWLDQLPFHVASQLSEGFGALLAYGPAANRKLLTEENWAAAGAAGCTALRKGRSAFIKSLDEINFSTPIGGMLYRTRMKVFFEWLRYRDSDPSFDPIRDIVREYIFKNFPVEEGSIVLGKICEEQQVYSVTSARKKFGVSSWRLSKKLIELGIAKRNESNNVVTLNRYIPANIASAIAADLKVLVNASDAAKMLGVDRMMIAKLSGSGLIQKYFSESKDLMLYLPEEIYRFVGTLRDLTIKGEHQRKNVSIMKAARNPRLSAENLVRIILNNRISMTADDPSNARFNDFRVSVFAIKETFFLDERESVRPARASEILKVSTSTVHALISIGVLRSTIVREHWCNRDRIYVCPQSIQEFDVNYISLASLAEKTGRSPMSEAAFQRGRGSYPLNLRRRRSLIFEKCKAI